ncbi:MAG: secretin N-terminal domain-containing protein [Thermoguttaceae bacterium]
MATILTAFLATMVFQGASYAQGANNSFYRSGTINANGASYQSAGSPANQNSDNYVAVSETTGNSRCVQKTFRAPQNQNAALIGAFILRLLPEQLRDQTSCRYSEEENLIVMYGPEQAINLSENLLNNFSETLFEAFLTSGEFVSVAGVSKNRPIPIQEKASISNVGKNYYDPSRNDYVKVAFEPEGAIVPNRQQYAVAFGSGNSDRNSVAALPEGPRSANSMERQTMETVLRQNASTPTDSSILDVVTYRCAPSICEYVGKLIKEQFGVGANVTFIVDRQLGTIVVHASQQKQEEVRKYLETLQIHPVRPSSYEPDLRIARGDIIPVTGANEQEENRASVLSPYANQLSRGNNYSVVSDNRRNSLVTDVYTPQTRKAEELQDSLLQLFGERFIRLQNSADAPFSQRQIVSYRFVKRASSTQTAGNFARPSCDISFDQLHNRIGIEGDPELCSEMLILLRAMDQAPLNNGNVRRFIPIKNCDPSKLRQIFEYDSSKTAFKGAKVGDPLTVISIANELCTESLPDEFPYAEQKPLELRLEALVAQVVSRDTQDCFNTSAANSRIENSLDNAFDTINALAESPLPQTRNGVRQVAYQEGDLGLTGSDSGLVSDFNDWRQGRNGVGVVQDFIPTVLSDLDVVIVDNATDAEFERIRQMIEQIEELAKIAEVSTEICNLKYVDCAMLHGVLTTLYAEMFATKQGRVVFYALQNPNALLVAGWGQAFEDMKSLIQLFDQPVADGAGTYRVVHLKYASVDEIAALLTETFTLPQTTGTGGFAPRIRVFADVRTNSLVVQASPNDWAEIQKLLVELDVNKVETKLVTRIFPLKNSLAEDLRQIVMNAILPAKQGTLDTSAAKFPVLQLLSVDDTGRRLVESGVMMDVDVSADVYHNQLIVSAPEDCMEFMERLIELLDVAPKKAQIRFFQVRHGDASQIVQTLQSLLATTDSNLSAPTLPQVESEESFVPVRFAVDTRTNVIIAAAAPKELSIVDALIVALDVKDTAEREEEVIQLRNIQALVVAEAIDSYLTQKQTLETASEVLSNYQLYESQIIVIPESISNSIIVSASPTEMPRILEMIKTFDQDPPQVQIKVLIAEVTLTNQEEFGIETGLQNSTSFDRSFITSTSGGATGTPGFDIIGSGGPGKNMATDVNPTDIAGQVLNNFGMGATSSSLGYGGFVLSASSRSIAATLRALREKNRLQVLSCPEVTAMDNQQAFILVGQRVPRIDGTTTTNYGVQMNTTDTPVGLILLVTPRVTKDGKVVMEIGAEKSSLGNEADATPIYSQDGEVIKSKSIDTIQTMTAISARDGETVMLGGLMTSQKEKISRGVPYLSDVPVLGWLFRYDQESIQRKELLIVMTPRIMRNSEDFSEVMRREMSKTHIDLDDAMQLNGNMGLYDPSTDQGLKTKNTKRLLNDLILPDKMDDLEKTPGYSPSDDYIPRPIIDGKSDSYAPPKKESIQGAESVIQRRYSTRNGNAQDDSQNQDFYLDDLSQNDRGVNEGYSNGERTKVAEASLTTRNYETTSNQSRNASPKANLADTSSQESAPRKALGISPYRELDQRPGNVVKLESLAGEKNSVQRLEAEAYNIDDSNIRGQIDDIEEIYLQSTPRARTPETFKWLSQLTTTVPYTQAKESSKFKLFKWSK